VRPTGDLDVATDQGAAHRRANDRIVGPRASQIGAGPGLGQGGISKRVIAARRAGCLKLSLRRLHLSIGNRHCPVEFPERRLADEAPLCQLLVAMEQ